VGSAGQRREKSVTWYEIRGEGMMSLGMGGGGVRGTRICDD